MGIQILMLCFTLGIFMTLHVTMNARVGALTSNPVFANLVFWLLGSVVAVVAYVIRPAKVQLSQALAVPLWLYAAGFMGVAVSLGVIFAIPRAGIGSFTVLILAGQLVCSSIFDATGFLSDAVIPLSPVRLLGFVLVLIGSYLVITR